MQYIVLTPAYEDLYDEIVTLFAEWPDVMVVIEQNAKTRGSRRHPINLSLMCRGISNAAGNA
jgi:hypothetical protein